MENHPIPQDITGFQFKLIGDMTVKQFAYLASGSIFAWLIFSLPLTYLIKLPFSSLSVLFGISFAFLSISGRPMDTMIFNFIRATFSPTKYVYQSPSFDFSFDAGAKKQEVAFNPAPLPVQKTVEEKHLDKKEFDFFHMLSQMLHPGHGESSPSISQGVAQTSGSNPYVVTVNVKGEKKEPHPREDFEKNEVVQVEKLEEQTENLEEQLKVAVEAEKATQDKPSYDDAHNKVLEIEKLLNETLASKQSLERELQTLKKELAQHQKQIFTPSQTVATKTPNVRTITTAAQGKSVGLPTLPEFPNMVVGIIKDPRGNPLGNILVEVKDIDGNPVRAFKTNALGNFAASTPLTNGTYTIEFEDPKGMQKFDTIRFEAKGDIILPIEVISIDTREELRKSLFN